MTLQITLPPLSDGKPGRLPLCTRSLVIIGANGSGKSRFENALERSIGARAFGISSLSGLYGKCDDSTSIGRLFKSTGLKVPVETGLDALIAMLLDEELKSLLAYKLSRRDNEVDKMPLTKLDKLIALWQEIYPGNRMHIETHRLAFTREGSSDSYDAWRLSDGERAVLYLAGSMLYAPHRSIIMVDSPEMFLHPTIMQSLWNRLEQLRPDCTMIYTTHDLEFAASRSGASTVWVKSYDREASTWDYSILPPGSPLGEEMYMAIMGARKPVLFIEGDGIHSIDARLYPLIFPDYTVRSLGSCNKVIEATRTFNDLNSFHHMVSMGIVDRDRRDEGECGYLRRKNIMVPCVAEIENILLLEEVVRAVASARGYNENQVARKVKRSIIKMFEAEYRQQALMHTRHRVKRTVEYRVDGRFTSIDQLEKHISGLVNEIAPRKLYEKLCREFKQMIDEGDYDSILRVYNQKSMLPGCNVAGMVGLNNKDNYLRFILDTLSTDCEAARRIRRAVRACFDLE
ncbi:MAG: DUF4435 domain-containing protein [Muribaculaceae bacterium]|nr:DUF4435 domain-containing protein [Muribaculaceae bacterium]